MASSPCPVNQSIGQDFPNRVREELILKFNNITDSIPENLSYTVIAGIAMTKNDNLDNIEIVSIGTGTKCINGDHISMCGATVTDFHAEVIARRCFKDFLYTNIENILKGDSGDSMKEHGKFCLKPGIRFHLYINTTPCGDGRIFCFDSPATDVDPKPNRCSRGLLRVKREYGRGTVPLKGDDVKIS